MAMHFFLCLGVVISLLSQQPYEGDHMKLAIRPYVTTGVAIVGASVITVAPVNVVPTASPQQNVAPRSVSNQPLELTSLSSALNYYAGQLGQLTQFAIGGAGDLTRFAIGGTGDLVQFGIGSAGDLTEFGLGAVGDAVQGALGNFTGNVNRTAASASLVGPQAVSAGDAGDLIQFLLGELGQAVQFGIGGAGQFTQFLLGPVI
ncbi:hypothetical protein H7J88_25700 [Mycolicibacterium flavescens]|uniref:hypothetical protein n=1 Tax=Mycolicibacterium flavescens TaxID=1776 RepID=UPI0021F2CD0D|nr:hypothetical protein [Mycolicibacterium flavescens]MCV7283035.1 hypothetical protein [Mycolicibacterium flavescens]